MGGNLAWTLRTPEGTEYRMDRWTNSLPSLIHNPDFLDGKKEGIEVALEEWLSMKLDWENNHGVRDFKYPMTSCYAPYPFGLQPSEYGLVVTDFITHTILSLQSYSNLSSISAPRLFSGKAAEDIFPDKTQALLHTAQSGRIASYEIQTRTLQSAQAIASSTGETAEPHPVFPDRFIVRIPGTTPYDALIQICDRIREDVPPNPQQDFINKLSAEMKESTDPEYSSDQCKDLLQVLDNAHKAEHNPLTYAEAKVDFAPFTLETFSETPDGYEALRQRILELGFTLTDAEIEEWNTHIDRIREM